MLALITGGVNGLGLNPWPTWDWTRVIADVIPHIAYTDSLASGYAVFYDNEHIRRHSSGRLTFQSSYVPDKHLVYWISSFQYK